MKRRREQERDEAIARDQADARQEALLAELKARQTTAEPALDEPEPSATDEVANADEGDGEESEKA